MEYKLTVLTHAQLDRIGHNDPESRKSYFSDGSVAYCLLADREPILVGGIVNMGWHRGEAWLIHTPFFRTHIKSCYKHIKSTIPLMARIGGFKRVQSTCSIMMTPRLFQHLGFEYEGVLRHFGPNGENCFIYARLF